MLIRCLFRGPPKHLKEPCRNLPELLGGLDAPCYNMGRVFGLRETSGKMVGNHKFFNEDPPNSRSRTSGLHGWPTAGRGQLRLATTSCCLAMTGQRVAFSGCTLRDRTTMSFGDAWPPWLASSLRRPASACCYRPLAGLGGQRVAGMTRGLLG